MSYKRVKKKMEWQPKSTPQMLEEQLAAIMEFAAIDFAVAVLFMMSAVWMFEDLIRKSHVIFENLPIVNDKLQMIILLFPMILFLSVIAKVWGEHRWKIYLGVTFVYAASLVRYAYDSRWELEMGFCQLGNIMAGWMNAYYDVSIPLPQGLAVSLPEAASFLLLASSLFLLLISQLCFKRLLMGILPLLVLSAGMAVGYTPGAKGMIAGFAGIMLSEAGAWQTEGAFFHKNRKQTDAGVFVRLLPVLLTAALAVLLPVGVKMLFTPQTEKIAVAGEDIKKIERQIEQRIKDLFAGKGKDGFERVDNHTPQYEHKEVLQMELSGSPGTGQYLRGFFGTDYADGRWLTDENSFASACKKAGYDEQKMEALASVLGTNAQLIREFFSSSESSWRNCVVRYTDLSTEMVFIPYGLKDASDYEMTADTMMKKSRDTTETEWSMWAGSWDNISIMGMEGVEALYERKEEEVWYGRYVKETYLSASESVPSAGDIADDIRQLAKEQGISLNYDGSGNRARYWYSMAVAGKLAEYTYSTQLGKVPAGEDAVEYFLSESHTGYCTHFATAGVMILRELGVPARYATGYWVKSNRFLWENDIDGYRASVQDDNAHAWVEIYLDGIGWVPVEMTPANGTEGTDDTSAVAQDSGTAARTQRETEPESGSQTNDTVTEQQEQTEPESRTSGEKNSEEKQEQGISFPGKRGGDGSQSGNWRKAAMYLAAALAVAGVAVFVILSLVQRRRRQARKVETEVRRKKNRRAVRRMNRRIYRRLRRKGHILAKFLSDSEYEQKLGSIFPEASGEEWARFMVIAQKAYFSADEVSDEEVKFCHRIYGLLFLKKK